MQSDADSVEESGSESDSENTADTGEEKEALSEGLQQPAASHVEDAALGD